MRDDDSDFSDLEEEMARDYECFPESDDNNVRTDRHEPDEVSAKQSFTTYAQSLNYDGGADEDDNASARDTTKATKLRRRV